MIESVPRPIGMGCMRLSTATDRDEGRAIQILHAAFDAGVTFLDTADAYCHSDHDTGHNERLIAQALSTWGGDGAKIQVATKGGLKRPQGRWIPDGRAKHLIAACEASRRALRVERIQLYQLHAPDSRTPLSTSVKALASLKRDGLIEKIGLCNVTVGQIEEARAITEIDAVQVELSIWKDDGILSGVAEYCIGNDIRLIAYRPLGGPQRIARTKSNPILIDIAARHGATACEIAIAWLTDLSALIVPIPGARRFETALSLARAQQIRLTEEDRALLDGGFRAGTMLRRSVPRPDSPSTRASVDGDIVLIMGLPAAGKSTLSRTYVDQGYARVNRDDQGGSLRGLLPSVQRLSEAGHSKIVLDNTYVSRKSRAALIQTANELGLPVRCVWLATSIEDAQVNAVWRMLSKFGRLLGPDEMRRTVKHDVSAFQPGVQFRYQRELEPPNVSEGFSSVEIVPFERRQSEGHANRALIVWCEGVLRPGRSSSNEGAPLNEAAVAKEVAASSEVAASNELAGAYTARGDMLRRYATEGWRVLGLSWQPGIAEKSISPEEVDVGYQRLREMLGIHMDILYCPHAAGPPVCWCRKPLPGLGVLFIDRYQLDPAECIYIGSGPQDPGFARRLGFQYREADDFFGPLY